MKVIFPSKSFHVNNSAKILSVEISELRVQNLPSVFGIKSHKTGDTKFFTHVKTHRDADNDIAYFEYEPLSEGIDGWSVYLYND